MEVLRQLWRVLGIIFQGIYSLGKKYWNYRAQKAQQRQLEKTKPESSVAVVESQSSRDPSSTDRPTISSNPDPDSVLKPQIEIPLIETDVTSKVKEAARWYAPGQGIQIQNIFIADGFLYVGHSLDSPLEQASSPPGLVNPDARIKTVLLDQRPAILEANWAEQGTLTYETLSPEMRGVFLGWLATGRKEREIPAEALLLFLYGVEYRVIELLNGERTLDELLALILELERLEVHYAHHHEVVPKIQGLIECCQVQLALSCQPETLLALLPMGPKLSMALKVALGRCIEMAKPIPMTLLWAWYQSSAVAVDLKTPAKRCERAFNFLIQTRGEQQGFSVVAGDNPAMLPVMYEPFSPIWGEMSQPIVVVETVEIAGLEPQLAFLEPLIEDCTNDLDAYSRLIGRSPEAEGTPMAVALLPQELVMVSGNDAVQNFQQWLNDTVGSNDWVKVTGLDLLSHWSTATPGKIKKKEAELLGQLMAKLGFGYAPDVRYGQGTFNPQHAVVLFRLNVPGEAAISPQYPVAVSLLDLFPFVELNVHGQGDLVAISSIASHFELSASERSRLKAVEQWRLERPQTWKQVLGRLKKLSPEQQAELADALRSELDEDWHLEEARYLDLQGMIPLPKLDIPEPTQVRGIDDESDIDDELDQDDNQDFPDPAVEDVIGVDLASQPLPHVPELSAVDGREADLETLPEPPPPQTFVLDTQLIARRYQESQVASGLLDDIFTEPEDDSPASLPIQEAASNTEVASTAIPSLGLDEFHWHLLNHLGQKPAWDRSELEAIAQDQGLLLDGALENINDVAFDHCDEALTEGDDPIEVNDWVFDELKAA